MSRNARNSSAESSEPPPPRALAQRRQWRRRATRTSPKRGRGLRPDPRRARQPVRRIAPQRDEVGHELRPDPVGAFTSAGSTSKPVIPDFRNRTETASETHWYMSRSPVTISVRPPASDSTAASDPSRSSASTSGDDETPPKRREQRRRVRELPGERLGDLGPVGVVRREQLDPVRSRLGAEAHHDRPRAEVRGDPQQKVDRAEQRVDRLPVEPEDRVGQRVERAVEHVRRVDGDQRTGHPTPEPIGRLRTTTEGPARPRYTTRYTPGPGTARNTGHRPSWTPRSCASACGRRTSTSRGRPCGPHAAGVRDVGHVANARSSCERTSSR